jgi:nitroimidazol reductase NimA-like FMN-containing flavoprotein (pyridoxamine 5'-phosphate oxidase superfamily)
VSDEVAWLLEEGFFGYLGTASTNGFPHVTPMIFVFDKEHIFVATSRISKKLRNIRENPRVSFLVDIRDPSNLMNNRAVLISGRAVIFGLSSLFRHPLQLLKVRDLFLKKYPKYADKYRSEEQTLPLAWRTTLFLSRFLVRIDPETCIYWREARLLPPPERRR